MFTLFRVNEFVKFDQFNEKLPIHSRYLDRWKISVITTHDHYWLTCVFFYFFITSTLQLLIPHFIPHTS